MEKITEGRRSNAIYILGQIKGFLETLKGIEGSNIASVYDTVARQFAQALTEAGASDPYAVIRAVDEVNRVRGTGPIYARIYRKYFHTPVMVTPQEANAEVAAGYEDGVEQAGGENEDDYFADDDFEMDEPDFNHSEAYKDDIDIARRDGYFESVEAFVDGEDEFSMAYDDADEFLNEGWPREQIEVYLMDNYKSLSPEDINEIIDSVPRVHNASPDFHDQDYEHPVEEF